MTYYGLRISEYRACRACTLCLGTETPAPVTGAAADEYNLNVVDCDASVTVPRLSSIPVLKWGSGASFGLWWLRGHPQGTETDSGRWLPATSDVIA